MNEMRFDQLARLIGGRSSRRAMLKGMGGAAAIALGLASAAAPARAAMCVGDGGWCTADGDCCSGSCVSNYCAAARPAPSTGGDTGGAMTSGATSGGSTTTSAPVAVSSMPNTGVGRPGDAPDWLAPAAAGLAVTAAYAAGRARKQDREDESAQ